MIKKRNISFIEFIKDIKKNILMSIIGIVIVLIGVFLFNSQKISIVINFIGTVTVFTSTDQIIKKVITSNKK